MRIRCDGIWWVGEVVGRVLALSSCDPGLLPALCVVPWVPGVISLHCWIWTKTPKTKPKVGDINSPPIKFEVALLFLLLLNHRFYNEGSLLMMWKHVFFYQADPGESLEEVMPSIHLSLSCSQQSGISLQRRVSFTISTYFHLETKSYGS